MIQSKPGMFFSLWEGSHFYLEWYVAETGRCTPEPAVPGASLDPHHPLTVGHPPVMS